MSTINVNAIDKESGSELVLGGSGTTVKPHASATVSGFGKVLQFQVTQAHSPSISVDNNTTYTSAGSSWLVSITPNATNSKILISYGSARAGNGGSSYEGRIKIYRQIGGGGYGEIESGLWQTTIKGTVHRPFAAQYVDSTHNTTSQIDYQLYVATSNNVVCSFADSSPCLRWISAMEIGA